MPNANRSLAVLACALVAFAGCESGPDYSIEWSITDAVTLAPGESVALPITVTRVAENHGPVRITLQNAPVGVTLTPAELVIPEGEDTLTATPTLSVAADTPATLQTVTPVVMRAEDPSNTFTSGARTYFSLLAPPAPQPDFTVSVEPRQLDLNVGQQRPVTLTVTRAAGFTGSLVISLESSSARLQINPLTLNGDQTTATATVITDGRMPQVPLATRFVATSEDGRRATTGFTVNLR